MFGGSIFIRVPFLGYGMTTDGQTVFVNASTCTLEYKPTQPPLIFDLPNKRPEN